MTSSRIDRKTLEEQLPAILREQFRRDNLPRDHLPSWDYITANTRYSAQGLHNKCEEYYGQTLHEFLREQGFGVLSSDDGWPTDDEKTRQSLEYYKQSLEDKKGRADTTIASVESAINKVYEAIGEEDLDIEILYIGYYNSEKERTENIQYAVTILQYMEEQLPDGTKINYSGYFSDYYKIAKNNFKINFNPVEKALDEFDWARSGGDADPISASEVRELWNALDALEECPFRGYDLDKWRLWMKVLIVFLIAVGPRSSEVEQIDVRKQFHFGDDPHVHFEERKNLEEGEGPVDVPIMTGAGLLEAYVDYIESTSGNGKLVPSPQSQSGSRTAATLNNWLERLCGIAGVHKEGGDSYTIQNFRQFWRNQYKEALQENRKQIEFISEEGATKTPEVDEENYITKKRTRKDIRDIGREYFDEVLDYEELPALLQTEVEQNEYIDRQTSVSEYDTDS